MNCLIVSFFITSTRHVVYTGRIPGTRYVCMSIIFGRGCNYSGVIKFEEKSDATWLPDRPFPKKHHSP